MVCMGLSHTMGRNKGSRKSNFAFFAPIFGSALDNPIEQNRRTSQANLRAKRLR